MLDGKEENRRRKGKKWKIKAYIVILSTTDTDSVHLRHILLR